MTLREEVIALIERSGVEVQGGIDDDTSLLQSGLLDSLALFGLVGLIEREIGQALDVTTFDLSREWDTIGGIARFIASHRREE